MSVTPGSLVTYREREWVVLPSDDYEIIRLRPIGGSVRETCGVLRSLADLLREQRDYTTSMLGSQSKGEDGFPHGAAAALGLRSDRRYGTTLRTALAWSPADDECSRRAGGGGPHVRLQVAVPRGSSPDLEDSPGGLQTASRHLLRTGWVRMEVAARA